MNVARILEERLPRQSSKLTVINKTNFSLYTPFLPEAAAGTLEPRHVITPLRDILKRAHIRIDEVVSHDPKLKTVQLKSGVEIDYDILVLALGSTSRLAPIPGLKEHAVGFKSLVDAIWLRNRIIEQMELANSIEDEKSAEAMLTFAFIGGGYAGLEAMAELQDFAAEAISDYPRARLLGMRWVLVESADRVLKEIDKKLALYATRQLKGRGIEIITKNQLKSITANSITLSGGEEIPTETVVWTAGVAPSPVLAQTGLSLNDRGQVIVNDKLYANNSVLALGDSAEVPERGGGVAPPTAQHAIRQAQVVAANVLNKIGIGEEKTYTYRSKNAFVNLGRYKAVGRLGKFKFSGIIAWWLARSYHLSQIPGWSRKLRLIIDWTTSLPFKRDSVDLGGTKNPRLGE